MKEYQIILVLFLSLLVTHASSNQVVEIDYNKLKENYPELTTYLLPQTTSSKTNTNQPQKTSKLRSDNFLYFNNKTNKFEGVSIQSTYSVIRLSSTKNLTLITSTTHALPTVTQTHSQLPLYHQFIYTIKLSPSNQLYHLNNKDLVEFLNEQNPQSSSLRLNLIKQIASQLNLNYSHLKLNWIEKLNKNVSQVTSAEIFTDSSEYTNDLENNSYHLLISLSNVNLLDLQKSFLTLNQPNANQKFKLECDKFFKNLKQKHEQNSNFRLTLFNTTFKYLKKVQLLKLCNLKEIASILKSSVQLSQAQNLIKKSTEDILFNTVKLSDYDNLTIRPSSSDEIYDDEENLDQNEYSLMPDEETKLINFKSSFLSLNQSNITLVVLEEENLDLPKRESKLKEIYLEVQKIFWQIVPEEDFLLAVIVPCTIIISVFVLTIIVACLLHMCNKTYKESKRLVSASNTTESTNTAMSSEKTATLGHSSSKSNPLYKQRAYLSKGVPVILYEEMSDRPIEDYDENDMEYRSGTSSSYYRSPLIMRNEKPPMPAPPEYSKPSFSYTHKSDENILNELQSMLQQSANIISLAEMHDDLGEMLSSNKSSISTHSPQLVDVDDCTQLLYQKINKTDRSVIGRLDLDSRYGILSDSDQKLVENILNNNRNRPQQLSKLLPKV